MADYSRRDVGGRLRRWAFWLVCVASLLFSIPVFASDAALGLKQSIPSKTLGRYFEYVATSEMAALQSVLSNPDVIWQENPSGIFNQGYSTEFYWLRLRFQLAEPRESDWILSIENGFIDQLDVYLLSDGFPLQIVRTGASKGFNQRSISHRHFIFPLSLKPGHDYELYVRVFSQNTLAIPIGMWTREHYIEHDGISNQGIGVVLGACLVLGLTALAFFLFLRDKALLYFAGYIFSLLLYTASDFGIAYRWVWPNWPQFNSFSLYGFSLCLVLWISAFTRELFRGNERRYHLHVVLSWALRISFVLPLVLVIFPRHFAFPVILFIVAIFHFGGTILGGYIAIQGRTAAAFYTVAMGILSIVFSLQALNQTGAAELHFFNHNILALGTSFASFLFLIAVTEQFREQRKARSLAQEKMLSYEVEMRIAKDDALQSVKAAKFALESMVLERTQTLEQTLQELQWAKAEVDEASAQKSRFLAAASHDIRQPLHALSLLVESVEAEPASVEREIGKIRESVASLTELFNNLFDISKLENGLIKPNLVPVDINHIVANIQRQMSVVASERQMELNIVLCDFWCLSDKVLIQRVLTILVDNAIKHSDAANVSIGCYPSNNTLKLRIKDNGMGVPQSEQQKIFEAFYQLKNPERSKRKGMGLGLALCRRIIDVLGYELRFESKEGEGCLFEISMPLIPPQLKSTESEEQAPMGSLALDDLTVLVIDDEETILASTERLLSKWGVKVLCAENVSQALEQAKRQPDIDLIISDYRLPGELNGFEVVKVIQQQLKVEVQALVITGDLNVNSPDDKIKVIRKPIKPGKLRAILNGVVIKNR